MAEERDYYRTLGVPRDADSQDIKRAYRRRAKEVHPDAGGSDDARFSDLNQAYHTLRDSTSRREHDRQLRQAEGVSGMSDWVPDQGLERFATGHGWGLWSLFDLFGGIMGADQWWRGPAPPDSDVQMDLELTSTEAAAGVELPIELTEADLAAVPRSFGGQPRPFSTVVMARVPAGVEHNELFHYRFQDGNRDNRVLALRIRIVPG
ncbi:MAG: hypothetical protein EA404_11100 [Spirochaetaceae bacterium]|nr:MAG: hypothetical protein EA404_11100 [Spirochaetaceae bacterium]